MVQQGPGPTGLSPSWAPPSRGLGPGPSLRTLLQTIIRTAQLPNFHAGLFPVRFPLLGESFVWTVAPHVRCVRGRSSKSFVETLVGCSPPAPIDRASRGPDTVRRRGEMTTTWFSVDHAAGGTDNQIHAPAPGGRGAFGCATPRQTCPRLRPRAQLAFKDSMIHGILQFTLSIVFRYILHHDESRDIRCRESPACDDLEQHRYDGRACSSCHGATVERRLNETRRAADALRGNARGTCTPSSCALPAATSGCLSSTHVGCRRNQRVLSVEIRWNPPLARWWKLNFDGASKGNPTKDGGGSVIKGSNGIIKVVFCSGFGINTNNFAEFSACVLGLKVALRCGIKKLVVEGDRVVNCATNRGIDLRIGDMIIEETQCLEDELCKNKGIPRNQLTWALDGGTLRAMLT
eukprot:Gb_26263 [translate_table: standard]